MSRRSHAPQGALLLVAACVLLVACGDSDLADGQRGPVAGFGEVAFTVRSPEGEHRGCALLAETGAQRRQGLMDRKDLAGYDAMIFRFPEDSTSGFWMRNTPLPLSIAWFDSAGRFVSAADMAPCGDTDTCPLYYPAGPARFAVEVPRGGLDDLGIARGSRLATRGRCGG